MKDVDIIKQRVRWIPGVEEVRVEDREGEILVLIIIEDERDRVEEVCRELEGFEILSTKVSKDIIEIKVKVVPEREWIPSCLS